MDVSDTYIGCYSGCLTSSEIMIVGASNTCHSGDIFRNFLTVLGIAISLVLLSTIILRLFSYFFA